MAVVSLSPIFNAAQEFTAGGIVLSGGLLNTYAAGTVTPALTYTTNVGNVANSNPIQLGADGRPPFEIWLVNGQAYKFILTDSSGLNPLSFDNIAGINDPTVNGSANQLRADLADTTSAANGDALIGVLKTASGAVATTQHEINERTLSIFDFLSSAQKADVLAFTASIDCRAAIATAVASARGKTLMFPKGGYKLDMTGASITLEEVAIAGEYVLDGATATIDQGSVFFITGTTNSPFKIRRGVTLSGMGWYYPNQVDSATPTVYPETLAFDFTNGAVQFVYIEKNVVYNAYDFCKINDAGGAVGHCWVTDNTIYAINRGFYVRYNSEVIKFLGNSFTFGHWLAATEAGSRAFTRLNGVNLQVDQSDGLFVDDNLFFGSLDGILTSALGNVQLMRITANSFDQVRYGIRATGAGNFSGTIAGANDFFCENPQNNTLQARSIEITTSGAAREDITIDGNSFELATEDHIFVSGNVPVRDITIGVNTWTTWAAFKAAGTYGCLNISGNLTNFSITGGQMFGTPYTAFASGIIGSCNTATCNGVTFFGCKNAINFTTNTWTGSGNVSYTTNAAASDVITATSLTWGPNFFDKPNFKSQLLLPIASIPLAANNAAAAAAGVPIGGFYKTNADPAIVAQRTV